MADPKSDATEIVPDSTTRELPSRRGLTFASSSASLDDAFSSPTNRYSQLPSLTMDVERPQSRWTGARTYGKKKDVPVEDVTMATPTTFPKSPKRQAAPRATGSPDDIPIEPNTSITIAETTKSMSDNSDDDEENGNKPAFRFSFLDEMAEIDQKYASDEEGDAPAKDVVSSQGADMEDVRNDSPVGNKTNIPRAADLFGRAQASPAPALAPTPSRRAVTVVESSSEKDSDEDNSGLSVKRVSNLHRARKKLILYDSDSDRALVQTKNKPKALQSPSASSRKSSSPHSSPEKRASSPPTTPPDEDDFRTVPIIPVVTPGRGSRKGKEKEPGSRPEKIKKPTKKMMEETKKESVRLQAERTLNVPDSDRTQARYSLTHFMQKLTQPRPSSLALNNRQRSKRPELSSDPIIMSSQIVPGDSQGSQLEFPEDSFPIHSPARARTRTPPPKRPVVLAPAPVIPQKSIDDLEMPDFDDIMAESERSRKERENIQRAAEKKRLALEQSRLQQKKAAIICPNSEHDDEDDELEIDKNLAFEESQSLQVTEDVPGRTKTVAPLKRRVLQDRLHAVATPGKKRPSTTQVPKDLRHAPSSPVTASQVEMAGAADRFGLHRDTPKQSKTRKSLGKRRVSKVDNDGIMAALRHSSMGHSEKLRQEKLMDWEGRGGRNARQMHLEAVKQAQEQGASALQELIKNGIEGLDEDDQGDYEDEEGGDEEEDGNYDPDAENDENAAPHPRSVSPSALSGDEDKENQVGDGSQSQDSISRSADRRALASLHDEEESEDKENAPPTDDLDDDAIPLRRRKGPSRLVIQDDDEDSSVNDENVPPPRPMPALNFDADSDEEMGPPRIREPLFGGSGGKVLFDSDAEGLDGEDDKADGFNLAGADASQEGDGFTQLFGLQTKTNAFDALRPKGALEEIDLESQKLLPVMEVSTLDMARDDAIFALDQDAQAARERLEKKALFQPQRYLNEDGFFTQTRPMESPLQPSQFAFSSARSPTVVRSQLSTQMSLGDDDDDLENRPAKRIRRGPRPEPTDSDDDGDFSLASPPKSAPTNAFAALMQGAEKKAKKAKLSKEERQQYAGEFLQGEAQESDDEIMRGFGGGKEDEKEDDDDNDQIVEGLVDDHEMDASEQNEAAIREKYAEDQAKMDEALQKNAEAVARGEMRNRKKNGGFGLDGDDSSDEDDDDRRRRQKVARKHRQVEGDQLQELGNNPRTAAFVQTYNQQLEEEEDHNLLPHVSSDGPGVQDEEMVDASSEAEDGEEEEEEQPSEQENEDDDDDVSAKPPGRPKFYNRDALNRELLQAQEKRDALGEKINDVSWVDGLDLGPVSDDDEGVQFKEAASTKGPKLRGLGPANNDIEAKRELLRLSRMGEKPRVGGIRRDDGMLNGFNGKGRTAVTARSSSKASAATTSAATGVKTKLSKTTSMIADYRKKQTRFEES